MVMVNYKGPNPLIINGYKFAPGKALEVKDEDFWKMMNAKTFSFRVEKKIIIVPEDFPLEKPKPVKTESEVVKEKEEQAKSRDLPSLKATLRSIEDSDDADDDFDDVDDCDNCKEDGEPADPDTDKDDEDDVAAESSVDNAADEIKDDDDDIDIIDGGEAETKGSKKILKDLKDQDPDDDVLDDEGNILD